MGRPPKLNDEVTEAVARLIKVGVSNDIAAKSAGIGRSTFYDWMQRGTQPGKATAPHRKFRAAVEQAQAEAEATLVARISKAAANGSWQAAAWLLERGSPERWAKKKEREIADADDSGPTKNPAEAIRDELAARRAART